MTISEWCTAAQKVYVEHGFERTTLDNLLEKLMLVVAECAEAAEAWRSCDDAHIGEELADVVIRTFEIAESLAINLEAEIEKKHRRNAARPFRHGDKRG